MGSSTQPLLYTVIPVLDLDGDVTSLPCLT